MIFKNGKESKSNQKQNCYCRRKGIKFFFIFFNFFVSLSKVFLLAHLLSVLSCAPKILCACLFVSLFVLLSVCLLSSLRWVNTKFVELVLARNKQTWMEESPLEICNKSGLSFFFISDFMHHYKVLFIDR